ncbi:hypothetical protein E8E95_02270 [Pseudomonas sp. BN414]|uniref:hypothetical protein n=1 Tax=Pseudomonas sp. BN414 TaxID=2567888 RepID=UPI002456898F|nr:hypothetical protein [Pseudomonas sp. BN414]MDH4565503.1 hypothetical protein [Pseudomonas sp. BN414]
MIKLISARCLAVIHDRATGTDLGSRFHVVANLTELTEVSVQTISPSLLMWTWLAQLWDTTVAMELAGVYWIPGYEILARSRHYLPIAPNHLDASSPRIAPTGIESRT